ncbi:EscU/YscU/HrcU family type III secretion system export apparatus switch protein [Devosia sp. RR2S18]|jgi:flagellar biosynthesis protein|uniref:EscU/YscU/HrcU family type III secretion system export apparatus switch protein n=1 Tax=Devosia rhizosphaerae TaxID=3049774 RepID=UPI0025412529|nr:EscU/YscU/HrcU family type III secretion system export apparatus switch protein [Devosia sp. RR2S18]WIJ23689.1 EscU/YscU/HrcU family type III secretion system export apparatus switch protein [Devosia sp. RR2S18]
MSIPPVSRPLAVALQYEKGSREAPRVVAKGRGLLAERIVALAQENDVVIEANPALAEALSGVELDDTIPVELYEAAAIVIGFVLRTSKS